LVFALGPAVKGTEKEGEGAVKGERSSGVRGGGGGRKNQHTGGSAKTKD